MMLFGSGQSAHLAGQSKWTRTGDVRAALLHVRNRVLGHGEHGEDVAAKHALYLVKVDVGEVLAQDLLGGVVD